MHIAIDVHMNESFILGRTLILSVQSFCINNSEETYPRLPAHHAIRPYYDRRIERVFEPKFSSYFYNSPYRYWDPIMYKWSMISYIHIMNRSHSFEVSDSINSGLAPIQSHRMNSVASIRRILDSYSRRLESRVKF